jgi:hypothetical protein
VTGSIYAIYQHAAAVALGYKTQHLLREREQVEQEMRQLQIQRAYFCSPHVLEQAADRLGLVRPDSSQIIVAEAGGEWKRWLPANSQPQGVGKFPGWGAPSGKIHRPAADQKRSSQSTVEAAARTHISSTQETSAGQQSRPRRVGVEQLR